MLLQKIETSYVTECVCLALQGLAVVMCYSLLLDFMISIQ